ncbi:MAG TPA: carbohydrate ABC transporter permease, partial [Clostridiales bacterium]|nr:carbohydrate ABC transporter permease [Clostridiales bacterium]
MRDAKRGKKKIVPFDILAFFILLILGIIMIIPFVWMTVVSFERYANIQPPFPPSFKIRNPSLFNFKLAFENGYILKAYFNSLIVSASSVVVCLISSTLAGYAFSKGRFKGKKLLFYLILATLMIPLETRLIPMCMMFNKINMVNSFLPLILPYMIEGFQIMLSKQFFDHLPDSLREAAYIDGSGEFRTFFNIFLPLTGPITATMCILTFMASWNSFLWPLVMLTGAKSR